MPKNINLKKNGKNMQWKLNEKVCKQHVDSQKVGDIRNLVLNETAMKNFNKVNIDDQTNSSKMNGD